MTTYAFGCLSILANKKEGIRNMRTKGYDARYFQSNANGHYQKHLCTPFTYVAISIQT